MELLFSKCRNRNLNKVPRTYSVKPTVKIGNTCSFPELAILGFFKRKGYRGFWVDAFHKKYWTNASSKYSFAELKGDYRKIVNDIKKLNGGKISGCWDLIIWKGVETKFVESKGKPCNDKIRKSQIEFMDRLISAKFKKEDFIVMEWDYNN